MPNKVVARRAQSKVRARGQKRMHKKGSEVEKARRHLRVCERKFKDGDIEALSEAVNICFSEKIAPAEWIDFAVYDLVEEKIFAKRKRGRLGNRNAELRQAGIQTVRWATVVQFKLNGNTWDHSYELASQELRGSPAQGSAGTMRRSYKTQAKRGKKYDAQDVGLKMFTAIWPAPGSEDTKFGVTMEPEVGHGEAEVYAGVQA